MKNAICILALLYSSAVFAQHCPWDCAGMIMIQSPVSKDNFYKFSVVLVDSDKKEITDTIFGTGKGTWDDCRFVSYEDFTAMRKKKIRIHSWYAYDTVYAFSAGNFIVKFNYCKYQDKKLYIRFVDRYTRGLTFHYIEVPLNRRLHLHNYNNELQQRKTQRLKELTQPLVMKISCEDLGLRPADCK